MASTDPAINEEGETTTSLSLSDSDDDSSSDTELNPNSSALDADIEGISLLKEIFPDESINTLRQLHFSRVQRDHYDQKIHNGNIIYNNGSDRKESTLQKWNEMEANVLRDHLSQTSDDDHNMYHFTVLIHRDPMVGLGMTLQELSNGTIQVCKLKAFPSPSANAGIRSQDILIGINGIALSMMDPSNRMNQVVTEIQQSSNPIVLHFQRENTAHSKSLLDATSQQDFDYLTSETVSLTESSQEDSKIHPFAKVLQGRGLLQYEKDQVSVSDTLKQFTKRASQWESEILKQREGEKERILLAPSTPYPSEGQNTSRDETSNEQELFASLSNVRTALSTRIVNYFLEEDSRIAYTIWVCDVESGREWYAPIRYFEDFCDLRDATLALAPNDNHVADFAFPTTKPSWATLRRRGDLVSSNTQNDKCRQLEKFLRGLCGLVYSAPTIDFDLEKTADHLQSFLGTDVGLSETDLDTCIGKPVSPLDTESWKSRWLLKRSIQRYTWRLFQLEVLRGVVDNFVDMARARAPELEEINRLEAQGRRLLKERAMYDLESIRQFLNLLVDLIMDSEIKDEMYLISRHDEYATIQSLIADDEAKWESLVREAVREQVEIEVYVPLRLVVSRLLVNGWRHEDMEIQFKIRELQKRRQDNDIFRIPKRSISPSNWKTVASILRHGVGNSTLPCTKLRAIVNAAREISQLHVQEHHGDDLTGGADDFLPVFIFCVVQANLERPCALCILLCTLVDEMNSIGEIGYYLASFEAVITHLHEIDLAAYMEENLLHTTASFSVVSLDD